MCHVGVGGFHRSHQAVYTDDLLEINKDNPAAPRWAICGIGLMPWDRKMYEALRKQVGPCVWWIRACGGRGLAWHTHH